MVIRVSGKLCGVGKGRNHTCRGGLFNINDTFDIAIPGPGIGIIEI
jgi:hypothetical protein